MLLDTSGLLCRFDKNDAHHRDAISKFDTAPSRLTHSYVLDELVALCHARKMNRAASLIFATDLLNNPKIEIVWVDEALHREALNLLQARLDKTYSLCDAVSFVLMRQRGLGEALTTDRHFEQEGFRRLLV